MSRGHPEAVAACFSTLHTKLWSTWEDKQKANIGLLLSTAYCMHSIVPCTVFEAYCTLMFVLTD